MVKIDRFDDFNIESKTLYVFDFDDTLVVSPRYEDIAKKYLLEKLTAEDLIKRAFKKIGNNKSKLKLQDRRIFLEDPSFTYQSDKDWTRKGDRLYLIEPDEFCYTDDSLPNKLKDISNIYKQVENKCIITARPESMREKIMDVLKDLGIQYPEFGLHMKPDFLKNAGIWKGEKIAELVKKYGFKKVIFYDDNSKYLRKSKQVVSEKLPNLEFITKKV